jgi:alpha-tubulin suppressor-like RCC1 family protein
VSTPNLINDKFDLSFGEKIIDISAGAHHSLALTNRNRLFAWGHNGNYQSNPKIAGNIFEPKLIFNDITIAVAGHSHTVLVDSQNRIITFGASRSGETGQTGYPTDWREPTFININLSQNENVKQVEATDHTIILTSLNRVITFGRNSVGQTGNKIISGFTAPADITNNLNLVSNEIIVKVSARSSATLLLTNFGDLIVFGHNYKSQLGVATPSDSLPKPTRLILNFKIKDFSSGYDYSLIISESGEIFGIGNNRFNSIKLPKREVYSEFTLLNFE